MINATMKKYDIYPASALNKYGQTVRSNIPIKKSLLSIHLNTHETKNNVKYKDCSYIVLTHDRELKEGMYIAYGNTFLLIKFISHAGRYIQLWCDDEQ